jgi:ankyrin repeat protein
MAVVRATIKMVNRLLQRGTDSGVKQQNGWTPLNAAARFGHREAVKLLLERVVDHTAATNDDKMPLWRVAFYDHVEVAERLLAWGGRLRDTIPEWLDATECRCQ